MAVAICALSGPAVAQVVVGPGESTENAFRRGIRGSWFAWLAAHDEGNAAMGKAKLDEILTHARRIGLLRLSDLALAATLAGRHEMAAGRLDQARASFEAATLLDPDLPEARWAEVSLSKASRDWSQVPRKLFAAVRADLADLEMRRIILSRLLLLASFSLAAVGLCLLSFSVVSHARRTFHDLGEAASALGAGAASRVVAAGFFAAPLLLSLDPLWWLVILAIVAFGYASRAEKVVVAAAFLLLVPFFPVLDRVGESLGVTASPILRGAEALEESRYDQRVLDDLEAVKSVVPNDPDISFLLGRLYQALGQNDRAIAEYTQAAADSPTETRALVNRGNIRFVDGDFGSAEVDFQEVVKRNPSSVLGRYNLSLVYAETFRTIDATRALQEARALDAPLVQHFQDQPSLVKVVSVGFTREDAKKKIEQMEKDARSRRLLGHFRAGRRSGAWRMPFVWLLVVAPLAAFGIDLVRLRGSGYAVKCQKCGRTFCKRCKRPGENIVLCSQCVHVYLKKDGVSIETKMKKVEEVKRRRTLLERTVAGLNLVLPGTTPFFENRPGRAVLTLTLFFLGLFAALGWRTLVVSPRPGMPPLAAASLVIPALVALAGWGLAQAPVRRN